MVAALGEGAAGGSVGGLEVLWGVGAAVGLLLCLSLGRRLRAAAGAAVTGPPFAGGVIPGGRTAVRPALARVLTVPGGIGPPRVA